ncbi:MULTISPECIES: transcriptional regulator MgsR [Bacillaceae]|mgnify:FL=1|jgi:Spx/MgsR family transcriptional regulator|uniref:Regulatory protein MgsR n=6 Tax=Bacillus subtilis TaxID=1423 RepID=MGSR_BACSU|nr:MULTISPECIES: transcriptional regulator MgsR [Bacillales]NP_390357.2 transcriptional regulator of stress [Bacillus subtilis subsp. subtilis str. 168]P54503.2 RecName: Full=Regulatory protein MgsR; AltName: Full=Modulator of the general stress response [Bacillus subtilis subsp. subtilis str. 168]AOL30232.1 transcriptional regulator [Alkalicoccobacillus gibsonii]AXC53553.1 regulatory protein MgsR [Bacillus spizizenii]MBW4823704.1 transcriptional regulator MgsR [Bacillaceae bacterium]MDP41012
MEQQLTFYSYPSCTSCRKTKHWLKAHQIEFNERHLFRETPTREELKYILSLTTEGIDEILATRSQTFKNLNLNIEEMTVNEVLELLIEKPKLLRRPILVDNKKLVIGYNPGELLKLSKKKTVHQSA